MAGEHREARTGDRALHPLGGRHRRQLVAITGDLERGHPDRAEHVARVVLEVGGGDVADQRGIERCDVAEQALEDRRRAGVAVGAAGEVRELARDPRAEAAAEAIEEGGGARVAPYAAQHAGEQGAQPRRTRHPVERVAGRAADRHEGLHGPRGPDRSGRAPRAVPAHLDRRDDRSPPGGGGGDRGGPAQGPGDQHGARARASRGDPRPRARSPGRARSVGPARQDGPGSARAGRRTARAHEDRPRCRAVRCAAGPRQLHRGLPRERHAGRRRARRRPPRSGLPVRLAPAPRSADRRLARRGGSRAGRVHLRGNPG